MPRNRCFRQLEVEVGEAQARGTVDRRSAFRNRLLYVRTVIPLLDRPHAEARALVASGAPVFLFVNPVEFHGPHLPLHTDALISRGLARDLFARMLEHHPEWPFLVTADLEIGVEPTPGPGSRPVPYSEVRARVLGACRAVADLGAQRVVLMTFHGNPLHSIAMDAGVRWLERRSIRAVSPFNLLMRKMLEVEQQELLQHRDALAQHVSDPALLEQLLIELPQDFHAGFGETSLMLHYAPDSVSKDYVRLPPCPSIVPAAGVLSLARAAESLGRAELARELRFAAVGLGWFALRPFPGYTGRPNLARAEIGAHLAERFVEEWSEPVRRVLLEGAPAPRPIMRWTAWLSLGGRIGGLSIAHDQITSALPQPG
jgi:creatinine amidohydrolase